MFSHRRNWVQLSVTRLNYESMNLNVNVHDHLWLSSVDNKKRKLTFYIKVDDLETRKARKWKYYRRKSFVINKISVKHGSAYYFTCEVYSDTNSSLEAEASRYYHTYEDQIFPTDLSPSLKRADIDLLKATAIEVVRLENKEPYLANCLFRNNHAQYFEDIRKNMVNVMSVSPKNSDGDPGCPITNRLNGIEFYVGQKNLLPRNSPFGDTRLVIPLDRLINHSSYNLYFADLYCYRRGHYVLLVVSKAGSNADTFCTYRLPRLPWNSGAENPFFFFDQEAGVFKVTPVVRVSIFYTEQVAINESTDFYVKGFGRRTVGYGKFKEKSCIICNLKLISRSELKFCANDKCILCPYINHSGCIESTTKGETFDCLTNVTCNIQKLVYAIECDICRAQYVGVAERSLGLGILHHLIDIVYARKCPLAEHINRHGSYSRDDIPMSVYVIRDDKGFDTDTWRKDKLIRWGLVLLGATCLVD